MSEEDEIEVSTECKFFQCEDGSWILIVTPSHPTNKGEALEVMQRFVMGEMFEDGTMQ